MRMVLTKSSQIPEGRGARRGVGLRGSFFLGLLAAFAFAQGCAFFGPSYRPEPIVPVLAEELSRTGRFERGEGYYAVLPPAERSLSPREKREAVVFYPGGKVEALAYLPLWERVSRSGYAVIVPVMPLDLAVFDSSAAARVRARYPDYEVWHLAGHSLGGAMAADYLKKAHPEYRSLILLGSYPPDGADLSATSLAVLSIREEFGFEGGMEKAESLRKNLPPDHAFMVLGGGNHAQFGRYGLQKGDGQARIGPEEQTAIAAALIEDFLARL